MYCTRCQEWVSDSWETCPRCETEGLSEEAAAEAMELASTISAALDPPEPPVPTAALLRDAEHEVSLFRRRLTRCESEHELTPARIRRMLARCAAGLLGVVLLPTWAPPWGAMALILALLYFLQLVWEIRQYRHGSERGGTCEFEREDLAEAEARLRAMRMQAAAAAAVQVDR